MCYGKEFNDVSIMDYIAFGVLAAVCSRGAKDIASIRRATVVEPGKEPPQEVATVKSMEKRRARWS